MSILLHGRNLLGNKRILTTVVAFFCSVTFILVLIRLTPPERFDQLRDKVNSLKTTVTHVSRTCQSTNQTGSRDTWNRAETKYANLREDKFTIAMQTYQRPKELEDTLKVLIEEKIPSLHEIVIVWNDLEATPPEDMVSKHGVPVRYRVSQHNSLNEKLWPDPAYTTQAILLSDDDVYYQPSDLEFVFQTWRKFGRKRMVGALARCAIMAQDGTWKYDFCSHDDDTYSMILTNLAFAHMSLLDYYSSNDALMVKIREYVDEHFNCEDIAMNYVQSMITGDGPLLVHGHDDYVNYVPKKGISTKTGHLEARSRCVTDFADMFGCMPLRNETAHIQRGVIIG